MAHTLGAAAVPLLLSVGHVLHKVDAKSNHAMARAVEEAFVNLKATAPEPRLFWAFIEEERNNILKEYRSSAKQNVTVRPGTIGISLKTGEEFEVAPSGPTLYEHVMGEGAFAGRDPRTSCERRSSGGASISTGSIRAGELGAV